MDTPAPPTVPARLGPDGDALLRGIPVGITVVTEPAPGRMMRWLAHNLVESIGADAVRVCFAHGNGRDAMTSLVLEPSVRTPLTVAALVRLVDEERPSALVVADACAYSMAVWVRRMPDLIRHVRERGMRLLVGLSETPGDAREQTLLHGADVHLASWEAQGANRWLCARNAHGHTGSFTLDLPT